MNWQIYTMFVNRKDALEIALESLGQYQEKAVVLDNSPKQDLVLTEFQGEILRPSVPLFCNQSYNLILKTATEREQDVFFMMHSDAKVSEEVIEKTLEMALDLDSQGRQWGVLFTSYDVLALYNTRTLKHLCWDTYLPIYYTDVDFYRQLQVAGIEMVETNLSVEHQEGGSLTQNADPNLQLYVRTTFPAWRAYYVQKWGGDRGQERFDTPFNKGRSS